MFVVDQVTSAARAFEEAMAKQPETRNNLLTLWFAHAVLAYAMKLSSAAATVTAMLMLTAAVAIAMSCRRSSTLVYVMAYIAGSEVLWRMTKVRLVWEIGKYATIALCLIGLFRIAKPRLDPYVSTYAALLAPGAAWTILLAKSTISLKLLSFNLSGPVALVCAVYLARNAQMQGWEMRRALICLLLPLLSVSALALRGLGALSQVTAVESNAALAGGFGPNQVSSALGLAAFLSFFLALTAIPALRVPFAALAVMALGQSALTLSRNGLYSFVLSSALGSVFLLGSATYRRILAPVAGVSAVVFVGVVFPLLNSLLSGAMAERFAETGLSAREILIQQDYLMWQQNPWFGVGAGVSRYGHIMHMAPHTEYTRLVAEHGMFGLAAMVVLVLMAIDRLGRCGSAAERAVTAALTIWTATYTTANAMRLCLPAVVFGLAFVQWRRKT